MAKQMLNLSKITALNLRGVWRENHILAPYTSWRVGGPAQYFYCPENLVELCGFLRALSLDVTITWLGAASNVLIRDAGVKGVVLYVRGKLNELKRLNLDDPLSDDTGSQITLRVEAGVHCSRLVQYCANLGMVDLMFLSGIPGTMGGALMMNAGAYGDEIWNYVVAVETIDRYGNIKVKTKNEFLANYRKVKGLADDEWFVAGYIRCTTLDAQAAQNRVRELLHKRQATQPLREFSCGSVFRNPAQEYAARLIETSGLKGKTIGGAKVSEKHANFIVNTGKATARDIESLIDHVIDVVIKQHGVMLRREVAILGGFLC